jgi:hypothetical protein
MHATRHRGGQRHVGIGHRFHEVVIAPQPPQQAIEQCKAFAVAMQDCDACKLDEISRHVEGAFDVDRRKAWRFGQAGRHLVFRLALHAPRHVRRRDVMQRQRPCSFTPAVKVSLAVEGDEVHGNCILLISLMNLQARQFD